MSAQLKESLKVVKQPSLVLLSIDQINEAVRQFVERETGLTVSKVDILSTSAKVEVLDQPARTQQEQNGRNFALYSGNMGAQNGSVQLAKGHSVSIDNISSERAFVVQWFEMEGKTVQNGGHKITLDGGTGGKGVVGTYRNAVEKTLPGVFKEAE